MSLLTAVENHPYKRKKRSRPAAVVATENVVEENVRRLQALSTPTLDKTITDKKACTIICFKTDSEFEDRIPESIMNPSCSHISCDADAGTNKEGEDPAESRPETKTEVDSSGKEQESNKDSQHDKNVIHPGSDEIERENFGEGKQLINQCSGMYGDAQKLPTSANLMTNTGANSNLASCSETISSLSNPLNEVNFLECSSKENTSSRRNITMEKKERVRKNLFPAETGTTQNCKDGMGQNVGSSRFADDFKELLHHCAHMVTNTEKTSEPSHSMTHASSAASGLSSNSEIQPNLSNNYLESGNRSISIEKIMKARKVLFPDENEPAKKCEDIGTAKIEHCCTQWEYINNSKFNYMLTKLQEVIASIADGAVSQSSEQFDPTIIPGGGPSSRTGSIASNIASSTSDCGDKHKFDLSHSQNSITKMFPEPIMNPSCLYINNDVDAGTNLIPAESRPETKTEVDPSGKEQESNKESQNDQNVIHPGSDEIEKEDFGEEKRLINQCSGMYGGAQKLTTSANLMTNTGANSNLASCSETISSLSNPLNKVNFPESNSEENTFSDSNITMENRIRVRKDLFPAETDTTHNFMNGMGQNFHFMTNASSATSRFSLNSKIKPDIWDVYLEWAGWPNGNGNISLDRILKARKVLFPDENEPAKKCEDPCTAKTEDNCTQSVHCCIKNLNQKLKKLREVTDNEAECDVSGVFNMNSFLGEGPSPRTGPSASNIASSTSDCVNDQTATASPKCRCGNENKIDLSYSQNLLTRVEEDSLKSDTTDARIESTEEGGQIWVEEDSLKSDTTDARIESTEEGGQIRVEEDSLKSDTTDARIESTEEGGQIRVEEDSLKSDTTDARIESTEEGGQIRRKRTADALGPVSSSPAKKLCSDSEAGSCSNSEAAITANISGPPDLKPWLNKFNFWSNGQRLQAIDALISRSAAGQVRHMMNVIEPLFTRDFISQLPKELSLTVLGNLKAEDLLKAAQTCHNWRDLADDTLLWKYKCRRVGITCNYRSCKKRRNRYSPFIHNAWKAAFMQQHIVEKNWTRGSVAEPTILKGHDDHVITCLQYNEDRIVSGSDDTTLKVWCASTGRCLKTLVGHTGGVWSSQMSRHIVISGSTDRTLRVWDMNSGHCLKILTGHSSTVRCMHLYKNVVVSGSRDATLRMWSIPDGVCMRVLTGHVAAVRCVQYNGRLVVSGSYDFFVKIWNSETGICLHTLAGHTNRVYSLQFDGVHVVSGSLDTSIRVWDAESGAIKQVLTGHQSLTSGMELNSNILVSGNADSTVKVWDISTGQCLHTLSGQNKHQSAVTCLQTSKRFVITSSDDGTVKLWDLRTGEFIRNLVKLGSGGSGGVVWRIRASDTKLICAIGSRNGTEETKLMVLNFGLTPACRKCLSTSSAE